MVTALAVRGRAQADVVLTGTEHLGVTSACSVGAMWDTSTGGLLEGGCISTACVNDEANLYIADGWIASLRVHNLSIVEL